MYLIGLKLLSFDSHISLKMHNYALLLIYRIIKMIKYKVLVSDICLLIHAKCNILQKPHNFFLFMTILDIEQWLNVNF